MGRRRTDADPLLTGTLTLRQHGVGVELVTGDGVFSGAAVDPGTKYLLRWLATVEGRRVLDIGCGYGPLALWLAAADRDRQVVAVDRDALAVECTLAGADRNGLAGRVRTHGSLGYDDIDPALRFDLVVSNVPAKIGRDGLAHLLLDARGWLVPGGQVAVVVVDRLATTVADLLARDPAVVVEEHHANRSYAVWRYRFSDSGVEPVRRRGFEAGVYERSRATFRSGPLQWQATTSYTLPEFDTLAHATDAAVELLRARRLPAGGEVALLGVGQGHIGLALRSIAGAATPVRLVDRDLLALRTAAANLERDVDCRHVARPAGSVVGCTAAIVALPEKQRVATTASVLRPALAELSPGAPVVLHGRSADVARVLDLLQSSGCRLAVQHRLAQRGVAAVFAVVPPR